MPALGRNPSAFVAAALIALRLCFAEPAAAAEPRVVASIAPVHSLAAQVMAGVGAPRLLVPGGLSPHAYALKPSDAKVIAEARAVFWIGPELERFLEKPLQALVGKVGVVALADAEGVRRLPARKTGVWANDDEDDHGHARERGRAEGKDDDDHGGIDVHLWLDPRNASAMVRAMVATLSAADPTNAPRYRANGEKTLADLAALEAELTSTLAPVRRVPYVVFHDAYQYFERRFGLAAAGAIAVGAGRAPGARRIAELRQTIVARRAACVFTEPQFEPALARTVVEGTGARIGTLDPLGATLRPGPGLYGRLLRGLARSLVDCLKPGAG